MEPIDVVYKLGVQAGYKFNIAKQGQHTCDPISYYNKANFPDVEITRPGTSTDLDLLDKKCLLTVNGYIYPTSVSENRLYIPKATEALLKSKSNNIGILSFNSLETELVKTKITQEQITGESPTPLYQKAILTFDRPIDTAFLVMAGYCVFEQPEFFYRVSDRSFVLRLDRLNFVDKLYELSRYRAIFEELGIPVSPNGQDVIDATVVRSDETVLKFLTLFNSFLVEIPGYSLTRKKIYLEHSNVPGNFRTELEPKYPVFAGCGKIVEYLTRQSNDTKYSVYTSDAYINHYLFSKASTGELNLYNAHRVVGKNYQLSECFFLKLSCEKQ